jgi:hypothetical protein
MMKVIAEVHRVHMLYVIQLFLGTKANAINNSRAHRMANSSFAPRRFHSKWNFPWPQHTARYWVQNPQTSLSQKPSVFAQFIKQRSLNGSACLKAPAEQTSVYSYSWKSNINSVLPQLSENWCWFHSGTGSKILRRHSQRCTVKPKASSGRPRKTSARDDRILYRICRSNRMKSASVLRQLWQNRINIRLSRVTVNRQWNRRGAKLLFAILCALELLMALAFVPRNSWITYNIKFKPFKCTAVNEHKTYLQNARAVCSEKSISKQCNRTARYWVQNPQTSLSEMYC